MFAEVKVRARAVDLRSNSPACETSPEIRSTKAAEATRNVVSVIWCNLVDRISFYLRTVIDERCVGCRGRATSGRRLTL